jgi:HAD superfamily hydrolase (TIGR01450 family)
MAADSGPPAGLAASDVPLEQAYDALLMDLDGVVYVGDRPVDGAAHALQAAGAAGARVVFVTNNAARPPVDVAAQLQEMGVAAQATDVMTSAIAAARAAAERFSPGDPVLVVGGAGVREALRDAGLRPVDSAEDAPVAVVQGFAEEVGWRMLAEASVALRAGAAWIATNVDATLPSPRGPLPGNGSLVAALATATGLTPRVIGKPQAPLLTAAIAASGGSHPLVVGDRLDTDIAGATAAGLPGLLVLTGVSTAKDLIRAGPEMRPSYIGRDLQALALAHPGSVVVDGSARLTGAAADERKAGGPDGLDPLRELCAVAWSGAQPLDECERAVPRLDLDYR